MFWNKILTSITNKWRPAKSTVIGIDIGTTKIAAVVARFNSDFPEILGVANVPFNGVTWAGSDKVAKTAEAIRSVVREACKAAGCSTRTAVVGISDITTGINSIGLIEIKRQFSRRNLQKVVNAARNMIIPEDMVILDQVVNSYTIDGLDGLDGLVDPQGTTFSNQEALTHTVICRREVLDVVTTACRQARLKTLKVIISELASASVLLSQEEQKQGVCLIDVGGEYTSMVVYVSGALRYTASVPWGGNHLTSCIGLHLGLDKTEAEKVKIAFSKGESINGTENQDKAIRGMMDGSLRGLCALLNCELDKNGLKESLGAGIILSGGTSSLPGLPDIFERGFALPVRRADYKRENWLKKVPLEYASAVGLVLHGTK
ncbi:MAG: cell division protein FtsA [Deltaproteobacteria bacterium]|nr:cell division protein FtsA [Deltaproteobacteria bacterium]